VQDFRARAFASNTWASEKLGRGIFGRLGSLRSFAIGQNGSLRVALAFIGRVLDLSAAGCFSSMKTEAITLSASWLCWRAARKTPFAGPSAQAASTLCFPLGDQRRDVFHQRA